MLKNGSEFRQYFNLEEMKSLDLSYLSNDIENWWENESQTNKNFFFKKTSLTNLILNKIKESDYLVFDDFNKINKFTSGVVINNLFTLDSPELALLVHESLSDIFNLMDIKYPYEDHKALFLRKSKQKVSEWGNGAGDISLHSDDLYEDISSDYLSLTTCRDLSNTPTSYVMAKDIFNQFTDNELDILLKIEANFISGKNVNGLKSRKNKILEYCEERGFISRLDFRIDDINGQRMTIANANPTEDEKAVFDKLFKISSEVEKRSVNNKLGTFLIIDNYKIYHARGNINHYQSEGYDSPKDAFRLLYRSKGPKKRIFDVETARYL